MRVESSLKGPMVPWTIEPFSSRMTALVGGTGKQFNQHWPKLYTSRIDTIVKLTFPNKFK